MGTLTTYSKSAIDTLLAGVTGRPGATGPAGASGVTVYSASIDTDLAGPAAGTTVSDLTALQVGLPVGTYTVEAVLLTAMSAISAGALRFGLGGPGAAGASVTGYGVDQNTNTSAKTFTPLTALSSAGATATSGTNVAGNSPAVTTVLPAVVKGKLTVTVAGTFGLVWVLSSGATATGTLKAGSFITFTQVQQSGFIDPLTGNAQPNGPAGRWSLDFSDEFAGTAINTNRWRSLFEGSTVNGATCRAANLVQGNGRLMLQLSSSTEGACISSNSGDSVAGLGYLFGVGSYIEWRAYFPGDGTGAFNWPAVWTSGGSWPTNGEHDVAEVLGGLVTVNYHYGTDSGSGHKQKNLQQPPGTWRAGWHTFGVHRRVGWADYYWDARIVRSVRTNDLGGGHSILMNTGLTGTPVTGTAGALLVDYVRVWRSDADPIFSPVLDLFDQGASPAAPYGWTPQGDKGSVAVDNSQRMTITTPPVAYGGAIGALWSLAEPVAGCDLYAEVSLSTVAEQYHKVIVRGDHMRGDDLPFNGYFVELQPSASQWLLVKQVDGTKTVLATVTGCTFSTSVATKIRIQATSPTSSPANTVRARLWQSGASEPATWGASVVDTDLVAGRPLISAQNGNSTTPVTLAVDNVYVTSA